MNQAGYVLFMGGQTSKGVKKKKQKKKNSEIRREGLIVQLLKRLYFIVKILFLSPVDLYAKQKG